MNKKRRERTGPAPAAAALPGANPLAPILLLAISAAESLLALFQWMELRVVRAGGAAVCGLSETLNCERVWETGFASWIHSVLGVPVAGLGLVWGLDAF